MKLLVATRITQGLEDIDNFTALEGEIVVMDHCAPDTKCPAKGAFFRGLGSKGLTSTAIVVERPDINSTRLAELCFEDWAQHLGMNKLPKQGNEDVHELLKRQVNEEIAMFHATFRHAEAGLIVRRIGNDFAVKHVRDIDDGGQAA